MRDHWDGPLYIKGLLDAEDAEIAVNIGAQGVVVSNHGGRQLDGAMSSIAALPAIADAVGEDIEVWLDSGVRTGQDVLKAVALGAKGIGGRWSFLERNNPDLWKIARGRQQIVRE